MDMCSTEPSPSPEELDISFDEDFPWLPRSDHSNEEVQRGQEAPSPDCPTVATAQRQCSSQQPSENAEQVRAKAELEYLASILANADKFDPVFMRTFRPFRSPVWGSGRTPVAVPGEKPPVPKRRRPPLRRLGHLSDSSPPPSPCQIIDGKVSKFLEVFEPEPPAVVNTFKHERRSDEVESPVTGTLFLNPAIILNPGGNCSKGKPTWQGMPKGILRDSPAESPSKSKAGRSVRFDESDEIVEIEAEGSCWSTSNHNQQQRDKRRLKNLQSYEMRTGILPIDVVEDEQSWEILKFSPSIWRHKSHHECNARDKQPPFYHLNDNDDEYEELLTKLHKAAKRKDGSSKTKRSNTKKKVQVLGSESDLWEDVWKVAF